MGRIKRAVTAGRFPYHGLAVLSEVDIFGRCRVAMDNGSVYEIYFCRDADGLEQTVLADDIEILGEVELGEVVVGEEAWPWGQ